MLVKIRSNLIRVKKIQASKLKLLRSTNGYTFLDQKLNKGIRKELKFEFLYKKILDNRWESYHKHLDFMPTNKLPKAAFRYELNGKNENLVDYDLILAVKMMTTVR